jgi:hypothetical protein
MQLLEMGSSGFFGRFFGRQMWTKNRIARGGSASGAGCLVAVHGHAGAGRLRQAQRALRLGVVAQVLLSRLKVSPRPLLFAGG